VTITVRAPATVPEDSRIEMKTDGFIGDRYLDIVPGQGKPLPPGGTIIGTIGGMEGMLASLSEGGGLGELTGALRTLLTDTSQPHSLPATLGSLHQLINELQPRLLAATVGLNDLVTHVKQDVASTSGKAGKVLDRLDTTVAETGVSLKRLTRELQTSLGALQKALTTTNAFLETNKNDVAKLLASVHGLSTSLQRNTEETLVRLRQVLDHADAMVVRNDRNLYATLENLRDAAENLKVASQHVRSNPAVLIWGRRNKDKETPPDRHENPGVAGPRTCGAVR
jgi:ABC-type transporter Mla subunit MlaD